MIKLRDYQERAVNDVRAQFAAGHRSVLFQLATGGGKTYTAAYMVDGACHLNNSSLFIVNRVELLDQTVKSFNNLGVDCGIIAAGYTGNPCSLSQVASIDTLKRRIDRIRPPRLVIWDECRGIGSAGWTAVYNRFPDALHLGLDATPVRLDGRGLGEYFSVMVKGPSYSELMARGQLVPFRIFAPPGPDMAGVRTQMGEFAKGETESVMDKPTLTGDIVKHYCKYGAGKLALVFAVSRRHSEHIAETFRAAGIPAAHLDGDTEKTVRKAIVASFTRREILVLTNVNLFSAGFDVPGIEVIIDAAPSKSVAMVRQRWGRGSRPEPGKTDCVLLDHAGNVMRHGLPDMEIDWSLDGVDKRKSKAKPGSEPFRQCAACYAVYQPPGPICPYCGHVHQVESRQIEQVDGDLVEVNAMMAKAIQRQKQRQVHEAKTLEDLENVAASRGYSPGWAEQVYRARKANAKKREEASRLRAEAQYEAFARR